MSSILISGVEFAKTIFQILKSDRYVVIGVGGATGEGKTTLSNYIMKLYGRVSKMPWDFNRMTWSRAELMKWIDGEGEFKEGQLPEYSSIMADELFHMFYKRNWYQDEQIDAISTFNMCRDRHLFIAGNVPDLWDLDGGFLGRLTFYIYVPERGKAWIFQQENNPFVKDKWNVSENKKLFRVKKNPYTIPNFVGEIHYPDMSPSEKKEYLAIRNVKRVMALQEPKKQIDKYRDIKDQRDNSIKALAEDSYNFAKKEYPLLCPSCKKILKERRRPLTNDVIAEIVGISRDSIRFIKHGEQ